MKKLHLSLQVKFLLSIILIVVPVIGVIFTWVGIRNERQAMDLAVNQARILSRQVIMTRQWIADCEGVMVKEDSKGAANTVYFYEDRLETPRGNYLKFTPSMATKKLSDYSFQQDLYRFRLSSLSPLNPVNLPDPVEKKAIHAFINSGATEVVHFNESGENPFVQFIVPLRWQSSCLDCHRMQQAYPNAVGGGLSVFLPIDKIRSTIGRDQMKLLVSGIGFILLTILFLFYLMRSMVIKPLRSLEEMTNEISNGNLETRVRLKTGDEFEKLGHAFNHMARRIARGRDRLEERIDLATCELSEANRELMTLDQLKSDFLANMSHELRSPLTVIRGGIDYLNRTVKKDDNRNYLEIIDKNLNRLIRLVYDLFDFTKIEAKKVDWSYEKENITVLVQEVVEITSSLAMDKKVGVVVENAKDVYATIDLERIEQVLVNLLENAIKFSDPETEIRISIFDYEDSVTVSVKDQGVGIPEKNLSSIFEKFSTVPSSGKRGNTESTGLGLAICKAIVEAHGGKIWAQSVAGFSTTLSFTLPKEQDLPDPEQP